jgi:peptidoglycan/LPS O-acetylase OafA/YrhL
MYYLTTIGFVAGMLLLAVGAARQGAVPAWAAGLLVLAVVMVASETAIISNAYFIAGAAVFLVAGIATALPILRMSDHEFARGGPAAA